MQNNETNSTDFNTNLYNKVNAKPQKHTPETIKPGNTWVDVHCDLCKERAYHDRDTLINKYGWQITANHAFCPFHAQAI